MPVPQHTLTMSALVTIVDVIIGTFPPFTDPAHITSEVHRLTKGVTSCVLIEQLVLRSLERKEHSHLTDEEFNVWFALKHQ